MGEIKLEPDWDYQPKLNQKNGHHVTRDDEHAVLMDFFTRRDEGSMLVYGNRGVGKTSSIIAAINEAKRNKKSLIPVVIKATTLDFAPNKDGAQILLRGLIRFLYKTAANDHSISDILKEKTMKMYHDSLATEAHDESDSIKININEKSFVSKFNPVFLVFIISCAALALGAIPDFTYHIAFGAAISYIFGMIFRKKITSRHSSRAYYKHSHDFSDLLHEFEDLMIEYSNSKGTKHKVLFILDEFDKIDNFENYIASLKMLINQGSTLFIFVTDPDNVENFFKRQAKNYTLFSQILFLKRPLFKEMEKYIDDIVCQSPSKNGIEYKNFRNYLCYKSRTDFFELQRIIRDHIKKESSESYPTINTTMEDYQLTKANLQKSIGWIYERKKRNAQSEQQINDKMIDALYETIEKMEEHKSERVSIQNKTIIFSSGEKISSYSEHQMLAVSDLFSLLQKQGYLARYSEEDYQIVGALLEFNAKGIFVSEEKTFKAAYEKCLAKMVNFANIYSEHIEEFGAPFTVSDAKSKWEKIIEKICAITGFDPPSQAKTYYSRLATPDPPLIPPENLQRAADESRNAAAFIDQISTHLLAKIFDKKLNTRTTLRPDTDMGFFKRMGVPKQSIYTAVLELEQDAVIKRIILLHSPPTSVITQINGAPDSNNTVVVCLVDLASFQSNQHAFIAKSVPDLKKDLSRIVPFRKEPQSFEQETQTPERQNNERKVFFIAIDKTLNSVDVQDLKDVIYMYL